MWLLELNLTSAKACGYKPSDLLDFLRGAAGYEFFHIGTQNSDKIRKFTRPDDHDDLENVLCLLPDVHGERLRNLLP